MKIKILYSHYNISGTDYKARPKWFDYEKCFVNFITTIWSNSLEYPQKLRNDVELHVIYDTTRGGIDQNWLHKYNNIIGLQIHEIKGGSMFGAAKEMYRISKELSEDMEGDDLFYFMENDYLHVEGWVEEVKTLYSEFKGLNYVTLYDHNDKYIHMHLYEDLVSKIFASSTRHWRTVPNTCGSYIVPKKLFIEDYDIHSGLEGDANKWAWLSENRNRFLLSPLPGLSTHCMDTLMSPTIDWEKINNK